MTRRGFVLGTTAAIAGVSVCSISAAHAKDKAKAAWKMKLATSSVMFGKLPGPQCLFLYAWQKGKGVAQMPGVGPADFTPWVRALAELKYPHYSSIFMYGHQPADKMEASVSKSLEYMLKCRGKVS